MQRKCHHLLISMVFLLSFGVRSKPTDVHTRVNLSQTIQKEKNDNSNTLSRVKRDGGLWATFLIGHSLLGGSLGTLVDGPDVFSNDDCDESKWLTEHLNRLLMEVEELPEWRGFYDSCAMSKMRTRNEQIKNEYWDKKYKLGDTNYKEDWEGHGPWITVPGPTVTFGTLYEFSIAKNRKSSGGYDDMFCRDGPWGFFDSDIDDWMDSWRSGPGTSADYIQDWFFEDLKQYVQKTQNMLLYFRSASTVPSNLEQDCLGETVGKLALG